MNQDLLQLDLEPDEYAVLRFQVGTRDAALILPAHLSTSEKESAGAELTELLGVVRSLPTA